MKYLMFIFSLNILWRTLLWFVNATGKWLWNKLNYSCLYRFVYAVPRLRSMQHKRLWWCQLEINECKVNGWRCQLETWFWGNPLPKWDRVASEHLSNVTVLSLSQNILTCAGKPGTFFWSFVAGTSNSKP